jgi:hypothetical protein
VGHQDYFLAPLPGSEVLLKSGIDKKTFTVSIVFISVFYFILFYYGEVSIWFPIWENYCHCYGIR